MPRTSRPDDSPRDVASELAKMRDLGKFGLFSASARRHWVGVISRAEAAVLAAREEAERRAEVVQSVAQLMQMLKAHHQVLVKAHGLTQNQIDENGELRKELGERLADVRKAQETNLALARREEDVRKKEGHLMELQSRLQTLQTELADVSRKTEVTHREAEALHAGAQEIARHVEDERTRVAAADAALADRRMKLDEFKALIQGREQLVARAQEEVATLARQRTALEAEIVGLKRQTMEEVARGERVIRDRELALVQREQDTASQGLLLQDRQRVLNEREVDLEERERSVQRERDALVALRNDVEERELRIRELRASIAALEAQRDELSRLVAALGGKL